MLSSPPTNEPSSRKRSRDFSADAAHFQHFGRLCPADKSRLLLGLLAQSPSQSVLAVAAALDALLSCDVVGLLPLEVAHQILALLDFRSLVRCRQVCLRWRAVQLGRSADQQLWKHRIITDRFATDIELEILVPQNKKSCHRKLLPMEKTKNTLCMNQLEQTLESGALDITLENTLHDFENNTLSIKLKEQKPFVSYLASPIDQAPPLLLLERAVTCQDPPESFQSFEKYYQYRHQLRRNWLTSTYTRTSFPGHAMNVVTCLSFDTEKIVSGSDDHTIHIYSIKRGEIDLKLTGHEGGVWALQYWENTLVSGSTDRSVRVWDMKTGECTHLFDGHVSTVRCLMILIPKADENGVMCPSEPLIITGSRDSTLRVWRLPDLNSNERWTPEMAGEVSADLHPLEYERARNPYFRYLLTGHTGSVRAIAGSGNILISGSYDSTVRCWDIATGKLVHVFSGHREKVYSVGYSPTLSRCVSGSMDSSVRIWCVNTGVQLFCLDGHTSLVGLLEISTDYLVTAAADATLRLWNPVNGEAQAVMTGHPAAITCFQHDPKLNRIVSGSDGGIKIWELDAAGYGSPTEIVIPLISPLSRQISITQTPYGPRSMRGRFVSDCLGSVAGVWRVGMDSTRCVCACQREGETWFEVLDFSPSPTLGMHFEMKGDGGVGNEVDEDDVDMADVMEDVEMEV